MNIFDLRSRSGGPVLLRMLFVSILLSTLGVGTVGAQPGDRRISVDPIQMVLPGDARIQSAAPIGSRTLAVWGSSRAGSDDRARNVLYMQMFEGAARYTEPRILTSPDAAPTGHVQVLAVGGSFVVIWNDNRSGSSQGYMARVALEGTTGEEERIGTGAVALPGMHAIATGSGFLLLWSDSSRTTMIRERRLDLLGNPVSAERILDTGRVLGVKRPTRLWGTLLLERGDHPPLLLEPDGRADAVTGAAAEKFATPYYLDDDGSVLSIRNGTLRSYATLLDTVADRTLLLPFAGSAFVASAIPSRDSLGRIQFHYAAPFDYSARTYSGFTIWRVTEHARAGFGGGEPLASRIGSDFISHYYSVSSRLVGATARRGCDNQYALICQLQTDWIYEYRGDRKQGSGVTAIPVAINRYGLLVGDSMTSGCGMSSPAWTRRATSKYASEIDLLAGGRVHRLTAPTAMLPVNVPDRSPVIMADGENFLAGYYRPGLDSNMMLISWGADGIVSTVDSVNVDRASDAPMGKAGLSKRESLLAGTNAFLIDARARWRERVDSTRTIDSQRCTIYLPTAGGWRRVLQKGVSEEDARQEYRVHTVAREPVSGDLVLAASIITDNSWYRRLLVAGFGRSGIRRWIADTIQLGPQPPPFSLIPLSLSSYLVTTTYGLLRFEGDSMLRFKEIGHVEGARNLPLSAGRLLRWTRLWPSKQVGLELFDSNGTRMLTSTATLPDSAYEPIVIANPNNGGFMIITASPNGVHAVSIGATLGTIGAAQRVSETTAPVFAPAAAIAGGMLNIVWTEKKRDGVSDIYGRSLVISQIW